MAKRKKTVMLEQLQELETAWRSATASLREAVLKVYPVGILVEVRFRHKQRVWTDATVICDGIQPNCVRVMLHTPKKRCIDVSYRDIKYPGMS